MAKTPKPYLRLTRDASGIGTVASLWLAADHLIIMRSTGHHEDYTRLDLADLKGVFLTVTRRRLWWGLYWGGIFASSLLVLLSTLTAGQRPIFSVAFLVFGGVGSLWNHLLGPGCRAYVLTGVQTAVLPSLVRMKQARKVLARLKPQVDTVQQVDEMPVAPAPPPEIPPEPASAPPPVA